MDEADANSGEVTPTPTTPHPDFSHGRLTRYTRLTSAARD